LTLPADCIASATVLLTVVNGRIAFDGAHPPPPQLILRWGIARNATSALLGWSAGAARA
jgi:hypothetical protein